MPSHTHKQSGQWITGYDGWPEVEVSDYVHKLVNMENQGISQITIKAVTTNFGDNNRYTGDSKPHTNMPPYLAVNMWQRIK